MMKAGSIFSVLHNEVLLSLIFKIQIARAVFLLEDLDQKSIVCRFNFWQECALSMTRKLKQMWHTSPSGYSYD